MHKARILAGLSRLTVLALLLGTAYHLFLWRPSGIEVLASRPARFSREIVVIDAGHGGEDGGAVSSAGTVESRINLEIALRLDKVLGLYGVDAVLLRDRDISLHSPDARTLREKKVSDIRNRVAAVRALENATLISIHQNSYTDTQYHGAQVFYANGDLSLPLAEFTQETLRQGLDPGNQRQAKPIPKNVYLMNHVDCRAILVECGFLTNPAEDARLRTGSYQTRLAAALAGAYLGFTNDREEGEPLHES